MNTDNSKLKTYLKIGITLFLVGLIVSLWSQVDPDYNKPSENLLLEKFAYVPFVIFIFISVIAVPIAEETVFRIWVLKSKLSLVFSILGILGFTYFTFNSTVIVIVLIVLFIGIFIVSLKTANNPFFWLLVTSLLFSVVHLPNFSMVSFGVFGIAVQLFGLGLIFGTLGLWFGFQYSILSHILYNLIVAFLVIQPFSEKTETLSANGKQIVIQKIPIFGKANKRDCPIAAPNCITGRKTEIIGQLLPQTGDVRYNPSRIDFAKYTVHTTPADSLIGSKLIDILINHWKIKFDTALVSSYVLSIHQLKELDSTKDHYETKLVDFAKYLENKFKIPVNLNDSLNGDYVKIEVEFLRIKSLEKAQDELAKTYGFRLVEKPEQQTRWITISN